MTRAQCILVHALTLTQSLFGMPASDPNIYSAGLCVAHPPPRQVILCPPDPRSPAVSCEGVTRPFRRLRFVCKVSIPPCSHSVFLCGNLEPCCVPVKCPPFPVALVCVHLQPCCALVKCPSVTGPRCVHVKYLPLHEALLSVCQPGALLCVCEVSTPTRSPSFLYVSTRSPAVCL